jgi:hypothetical protein
MRRWWRGSFCWEMAGRHNKTPVPSAKNRGLHYHSLTSEESLPFMDHGGEQTITEINVLIKKNKILCCLSWAELGINASVPWGLEYHNVMRKCDATLSIMQKRVVSL